MEGACTSGMELPGFRFHPTEEELVDFYLKNTVSGKKLSCHIIDFLNIYNHDPWDLPGKARINGEREWYFFVRRQRKHGSGGRPNRTTEKGFWKATGSDRKIVSSSRAGPARVIGLKKTLVFYRGRAPRGTKTDWVMNEYRLPDSCAPSSKDIVLCKIYRKATSLKVLEQRAADEEGTTMNLSYSTHGSPSTLSPPAADTVSLSSLNCDSAPAPILSATEDEYMLISPYEMKSEEAESADETTSHRGGQTMRSSRIKLPNDDGTQNLAQLQLQLQLPVPKINSTDCWSNQDPFGLWSQLRSPWLIDALNPYCNILNF